MSLLTTVTNLFPALFTNPAPYHLLCYSTLLGTSLYQTFVNTKICYISLPRSAFTTLQKRLFPVYFWCQAALLVLSAVTFPPHGLVSLVRYKTDWIPFALALGTAVLNLGVYGARTAVALVQCVHQETRDAKAKANGTFVDAGQGVSVEMKKLRRAFARNHATCIHLNLLSIGAMVVYGWRFAGRMAVDAE
ncbi:hypothetical protein N657DRAFT_604843 [Parathielavia appendiculata]|uniref:TMEM205-like domain-containing protein n=1 Tax=Parathielavia appendiculata TaxID=2587402 RepID=A0AAN6TR94_9PEZI|nr:hypothetical protein N657DRAFT_604843 [Parathielavia appendiculata]